MNTVSDPLFAYPENTVLAVRWIAFSEKGWWRVKPFIPGVRRSTRYLRRFGGTRWVQLFGRFQRGMGCWKCFRGNWFSNDNILV